MSTRSPVSIRSKPCRSSRLAYSASSRAPAIQPVQRSMFRRPSSLTGPLDRDVGDLQPSARPQDTIELRKDGFFVGDEVDDAVRGDDVEACVGKRQPFGLALRGTRRLSRPSRWRWLALWRPFPGSCRCRQRGPLDRSSVPQRGSQFRRRSRGPVPAHRISAGRARMGSRRRQTIRQTLPAPDPVGLRGSRGRAPRLVRWGR